MSSKKKVRTRIVVVDLSLPEKKIQQVAEDQRRDLIGRGVSNARAAAAAKITVKTLRRLSGHAS